MATRTDLFGVLFKELAVEEGFNIRYDYGDIQELSNSIVENGVKTPIHAYQKKGDINKYTMIEGHRRYKAIELAIKQGKIDPETFRIPMCKDRPLSDEQRTLGLITYNSGKPLTRLEEAMVYERLVNYGMKNTEISVKVGKSTTHISDCLVLVTANLATKKMIMDGKVAATLVIELLKKKTPKEVEDELKGKMAQLLSNILDEPIETFTQKESFTDNSDIAPKQDNTKSTGADTREMKEKGGKAIKITKKVLDEDKPVDKSIKISQMREIVTSLAEDDQCNIDEVAILATFVNFLNGECEMTSLKNSVFLIKE